LAKRNAHDPTDRPTAPPLEYATPPQSHGPKVWASQFIARLSTPMSLGMYYLITLVLSIIATILAIGIRLIVRSFE
jgi:hypothetical protein